MWRSSRTHLDIQGSCLPPTSRGAASTSEPDQWLRGTLSVRLVQGARRLQPPRAVAGPLATAQACSPARSPAATSTSPPHLSVPRTARLPCKTASSPGEERARPSGGTRWRASARSDDWAAESPSSGYERDGTTAMTVDGSRRPRTWLSFARRTIGHESERACFGRSTSATPTPSPPTARWWSQSTAFSARRGATCGRWHTSCSTAAAWRRGHGHVDAGRVRGRLRHARALARR